MSAAEPVAPARDDGPSGPPEPSRRGRPRSAEADEAILAAALELLGDLSIAEMSMDDLAQRAGVSKATIYRRWSSKEEVVVEALNAAFGRYEPTDTGSLRGDLIDYMTMLLDKMRSGKTRDLFPHLVAASSGNPHLRAALDEYSVVRTTPARDVFRRAVERGELAPDTDIEFAVDLLLGPVVHRRMFFDEVYDAAKAARLVDAVLVALERELGTRGQ